MKKLPLFLLLMPISLFAQTKLSLLQRIKIAAVKELKAKLNDPKSYEAVSWGELKFENTSPEDTEKYYLLITKGLKMQKDQLAQQLEKEENKRNLAAFEVQADEALIATTKEQLKKVTHALDSIVLQRNHDVQVFQPSFKNYYIQHSFRTRNAFNALVLVTYYFKFSKDLIVTDYGNVEK